MKRWLALVMSVAALGLVAGCGDDDEDEAADGGATTEQPAPAETDTAETEAAEDGELAISADEAEIAFDTTALTAPAGTVTITMENPSTTPHDVSLEGPGVDEQGEVVQQGGTSMVTAELDPGEYTFYCSVAGHRESGMEGTLTVE